MVKILVIEDEGSVRENIAEFLELEGFDVVTAADGQIGVKKALQDIPDLIICDVMMPNLDGYGVLNHLHQQPQTNLIPFIFLTAKATRTEMRHGMDIGADDYLTKPYTTDELLAAIQTRLRKHSELHSIYLSKFEDIRDQLLITLPHELRTPLVTIMGYADLLASDAETEFIRDAALTIKRGGMRLHHLIENYLMYAHLEIMRTDEKRVELLSRQTINYPEDIIRNNAAKQAEVFSREDDLVLDLKNHPVFSTDDGLGKIVEELTNNAFKFSEIGTPVEVRSGTRGNDYIIVIKDQGRGIAEKDLLDISAHKQFDRKMYEQQGAGMGLALCKQIVELINGEINIQSKLGQGTTIAIKLRCVQ